MTAEPAKFRETQHEIDARVERDIRERLPQADYPLTDKLVLACKILAKEGHARTLAGQVTCRADDDTFWTPDFASGLGHVGRNSLVRVDYKLNVVEGNRLPNPAVRFHLWIYDRNESVRAIVHTHPPYASALSMLEEPLAVAHMDATVFHDDCAFLPQWPGLPTGNEEGEIISAALGSKRAILLAHHGLLTTGRTLEEAVYLAVLFEQAAQMQMIARAAGAIKPVRPELAQRSHDFLLQPEIINATFRYWALEFLAPSDGDGDKVGRS